MEDDGKLLVCDSRADPIFQFDTRKRELLKSWPARGDGAGDMSLDKTHHRLFVGTRIPPEMTVYDSLQAGKSRALRPGSGTSLFVPKLNRLYVASQAIGDVILTSFSGMT